MFFTKTFFQIRINLRKATAKLEASLTNKVKALNCNSSMIKAIVDTTPCLKEVNAVALPDNKQIVSIAKHSLHSKVAGFLPLKHPK